MSTPHEPSPTPSAREGSDAAQRPGTSTYGNASLPPLTTTAPATAPFHADASGPEAASLADLLSLSHRIGRAGDLAVLAEGNTSVRLPAAPEAPERFLVKASGHCLADLAPAGVVCCAMEPLLEVVASDRPVDDREVDRLLREAMMAWPSSAAGRSVADPRRPATPLAERVTAAKPSVEAFFHAVLLSRPGVRAVAHAHPEAVLAVLTSPLADDFARRRRFPDEVVCCGISSLRVPYVDPGLPLARVLHRMLPPDQVPPAVILLDNHGVICAAASTSLAWSAMAMTAKAARVYVMSAGLTARPAAEATACLPVALPEQEVVRIHGRPDEAHRRRQLEQRQV